MTPELDRRGLFSRGSSTWPAGLLLAGVLLATVSEAPVRANEDRILVFAAASTTDAIGEAGAVFGVRHGTKVVTSFAASSTLARQIEAGAPADIFISANPAWMDYLEAAGALSSGTRTDLLGNSLALIAPVGASAGEARRIVLGPDLSLAGLLGDRPLAIADPDHVPAGVYAKAALEHYGLWSSVERRAARTADVRGALVLVERGEAALGIVYATDAAASARARVIAEFEAECHPPIVYPAAIVAGRDRPEVRALLVFLGSAEARAIFTRKGFRAP